MRSSIPVGVIICVVFVLAGSASSQSITARVHQSTYCQSPPIHATAARGSICDRAVSLGSEVDVSIGPIHGECRSVSEDTNWRSNVAKDARAGSTGYIRHA